MESNASKFFHLTSKDLASGRPPIPPREEDWPEEWRKTFYKTYPRMPKIDLLDGPPPPADFFRLINNRSSRRDFSKTAISKLELSLLLKYSCGNISPMPNGRFHRAYPSGGARFPIETYPIILRPSDDLKSGLYHYDVKNHRLNVLWERGFDEKEINRLFAYSWVADASMIIVMTAVFGRNQNKYGERGYRMILQESGHIGQNIYLAAEALGLKCCSLAGTYDDNLEKLIDIDGVTESVVYTLVAGK